tara:strand:- start:328 stop:777 length:450 start_codon:yes stop_codon:yes gene_type:complete
MALTKVNRGGLNTGISDSSNATFLTVDSSEQAVIKSEGGAVTTSVQQGLAKFWTNLNGSGTIATRDSFNISSTSDDATGIYTFTINSDMANANYHITGSVGRAGLATATISNDSSPQNTAGQVQIICANSSNAAFDPPAVFTSGHGDLA